MILGKDIDIFEFAKTVEVETCGPDEAIAARQLSPAIFVKTMYEV